jgi:hypothetical protein
VPSEQQDFCLRPPFPDFQVPHGRFELPPHPLRGHGLHLGHAVPTQHRVRADDALERLHGVPGRAPVPKRRHKWRHHGQQLGHQRAPCQPRDLLITGALGRRLQRHRHRAPALLHRRRLLHAGAPNVITHQDSDPPPNPRPDRANRGSFPLPNGSYLRPIRRAVSSHAAPHRQPHRADGLSDGAAIALPLCVPVGEAQQVTLGCGDHAGTHSRPHDEPHGGPHGTYKGKRGWLSRMSR